MDSPGYGVPDTSHTLSQPHLPTFLVPKAILSAAGEPSPGCPGWPWTRAIFYPLQGCWGGGEVRPVSGTGDRSRDKIIAGLAFLTRQTAAQERGALECQITGLRPRLWRERPLAVCVESAQ